MNKFFCVSKGLIRKKIYINIVILVYTCKFGTSLDDLFTRRKIHHKNDSVNGNIALFGRIPAAVCCSDQ